MFGNNRKKNGKPDLPLKNALIHKKLPILTLDGQWHELFLHLDKTSRLSQLEVKLNDQLKQQGKLVNDMKDMKKLKQKLLSGIVENMEENPAQSNRLRVKKQETSHRLILDINGKMESSKEELMEIPYQMRETNTDLAEESIRIMYEKMRENQDEIKEIDQWLSEYEKKLAVKEHKRKEAEQQNQALYSYLHKLLGSQMMEQLDKYYGE